MCGIIAISGHPKRYAKALEPMLGTLSKRGPDDRGTLSFPHCALGQTRLSIIDLTTGHQPMKDSARDIAISFNGEIYNYRELRRELIAQGYTFTTSSDTEVILKAYQAYGTDCLDHLDGMFAFALWDDERQRLFMARDRFGKKPLYYAFDADKNLLVASEVKALFASGALRGELSPAAIDHYLKFMYVPPAETAYTNVHTLPPAHAATFANGKLNTWRYWQLTHEPLSLRYDEAKDRVRELLDAAVRKRLVADVEIGALLSGGVDSTFVTALAQRSSDSPLKTFSVGYGDHINELPFAETAARTIGTDHHTLDVGDNFAETLPDILAYFDEPHADSSDLAQDAISRLASEHVKVVLTGDGADELFMGYGWYWRQFNLSTRYHTIEKFFTEPFAAYLKQISIFPDRDRAALFDRASRPTPFALPAELRDRSLSSVDRINLFDLSFYLSGQLLSKIDRMSMRHSLEVRSPFLDTELAEFVYNLPTEFKMSHSEGKLLLKDLLEEIMPREFVRRRKQGFGAPVKQWLRKPAFRALAHDALSPSSAELYRWLKPHAVRALLKAYYEDGDARPNYQLWVLLCLELWLTAHKPYSA